MTAGSRLPPLAASNCAGPHGYCGRSGSLLKSMRAFGRPLLPLLSSRATGFGREDDRSLGECVSFGFDDAHEVHRSARPMKRNRVRDIPLQDRTQGLCCQWTQFRRHAISHSRTGRGGALTPCHRTVKPVSRRIRASVGGAPSRPRCRTACSAWFGDDPAGSHAPER